MRFLPSEKRHQFDPFWLQLVEMIKTGLQTRLTVLSWTGRRRSLTQLHHVDPGMRDGHGEPLLRDASPELYLSNKYALSDIDILRDYGMSKIAVDQILDLVEQDLKDANSRVRSPSMSSDWNTKMAMLLSSPFLLSPFNRYRAYATRRVKNMAVIPLQDGSWTSANSEGGRIIFTTAKGVGIPRGTSLRLVCSKAEGDPERSKLFDHLGVLHVDVDTVRDAVLLRHHQLRTKGGRMDTNLFVEHLRFLYLTDHLSTDPKKSQKDVLVHNRNAELRAPHRIVVYLPDDHEFGAQKIYETLRQRVPKPEILPFSFLHPSFLEHIPATPFGASREWRQWLLDYVDLERFVPLIKRDPNSELGLSSAVTLVSEHCPELLLGLLGHNWPNGGVWIVDNQELKDKLKKTKVPCLQGQMTSLDETYLPFADLKERSERFLEGIGHSPLLQLPETIDRGSYSLKWGFLEKHLGVRTDDDMDFYLNIVQQVAGQGAGFIAEKKIIPELYCALYGKYLQLSANDMATWKGSIR